jgi:hypothetical protein
MILSLSCDFAFQTLWLVSMIQFSSVQLLGRGAKAAHSSKVRPAVNPARAGMANPGLSSIPAASIPCR